MNQPSEPNDPLLQALVAETPSLPSAAATQARAAQQTRRARQRTAMVVTAIGMFVILWSAQRPTRNVTGSSLATTDHQTVPTLTTNREQVILATLPEAPLLIVRNAAGEIARVHVFER